MRLTIKSWGMFVAKLSLENNSVIYFKKSYSIKVPLQNVGLYTSLVTAREVYIIGEIICL